MKTIIVLLAACALLSCHTAKKGAPTNTAANGADLRLHDIWALQKLNGLDVRAADFPRGVPNLELQVADRRAMGFGGCNQYSGSAVFERDTIRFGAMVATRMACIGAGGDVENGLLEVFRDAVGYRLEGLTLTLAGKGGVAVFKKVD